MLTLLLLVLAGLAILIVAGDALVRGAVGLAKRLRIPPLIIGLPIVAFGTSAPELLVTIKAVMADAAGIAMGNIIGSNIANVFLVLGVPALISPIECRLDGIKRNGAIMLGATAVFAAIAYVAGGITLISGLILFALIIAFVVDSGVRGEAERDEFAALASAEDAPGKLWLIAALLAGGLIGLPLGAGILVDNASEIARRLEVRDELIGLTIIAFGTSLPELATVIVAAVRKHSEVALGNVVGSNIFNLLAVGGAAGLAGGATFQPMALTLDIPVMIGAAVLFAAYLFSSRQIGRISGAAFVALYCAYVTYLGAASGLI